MRSVVLFLVLLVSSALPGQALPPGYCTAMGRQADTLVQLRDLQASPEDVLALYAANRAKHGLQGDVAHAAFEQWMVRLAFDAPQRDAKTLETLITHRCQATLR